jgi:hypothetical protein
MSITRLTGGLTPANGGDPRTFPVIWNATADVVESNEVAVLSQGSAITTLEGTVASQGSAISAIEAWDIDDLNDVSLGTAVMDGQVLAFSTAIPGWTNVDVAAGGGKILQVVSTTKTDTFSTSSSSFVTVTGLTATITPSSTSSKILIHANVNYSFLPSVNFTGVFIRLAGGNAGNYVGDANGSRTQAISGSFQADVGSTSFTYSGRQISTTATGVFLDSPNTASAVTYEVQLRTGSGTGYVNRSGDDSNISDRGVYPSSITVMEVAP